MVRLDASTLTEVVVAMVLLSIVSTVAVMIYLNTVRVLYSSHDIRLAILARSSINLYIARGSIDSWSERHENGDTVLCSSVQSEDWNNVYIVECIASDSLGNRSASSRQAIYLSE